MSWFPRFLFWLLICALSGGLSFFFGAMAYEEPFNILAMALGIVTFAAGYTWVTGTAWFRRFRRRPFINRTFKIGFSTRIAISIIFPIGVYVDVFCGMLSIYVVMGEVDAGAASWQVYVITLVQGTVLNIVLMLYMLLVWGVQRLFLKPPPSMDGLCETCGYDLRASRDVCPECGTPFASVMPPADVTRLDHDQSA